MVNKENKPSRIMQTRVLEILGCKRPFVDRPITAGVVYENATHKVYQIYEKIPFVKGTGIVFE